jgi:hypothetical protein
MFPGALRRDILILISIKAIVLIALYLLFFSPAHQFKPSTFQLASHIFGK